MAQRTESESKSGGFSSFRSKLRGLFRRRGRPKGAIEPTIYRFILRFSLKDQIVLVALTVASFPLLYLTLELPKTIVNHAINGRNFPQSLLGLELGQLPYLTALCLAFLALVLVSGWLKFQVNVMKGRLGERLLRRLRYDLYLRTLRFPLLHFSRVSAGEIIAMITAELEPVAGFIGESFALPIFQTGTLLTIFAFMFVQDPLLGLAAVSLYPVQGYIIPRLQRKVRQLGRRRVRRIRRLANRIGESIAARVEIRANDAAPYQLAEISGRLGEIYDIRYEIYRRKFFAKFLNNFLNQLTPFFFYLIGGYLVIEGRLSFGALVAILAAYKDLSAPWKELLDFYQDQQDVAIKYEQVVEQFEVPDMVEPRLLVDNPAEVPALAGAIVADGVAWRDPDGTARLEGVDLRIEPASRVAAVGPSNGGKFELAALLARLVPPTAGWIEVGGIDINAVPMSVTGRRIGYSGSAPYLLSGTLRETLLMGLRHRPRPATPPPSDGGEQLRRGEEARRTGGSDFDPRADWIDYGQAGVRGPAELGERIREVLQRVDFDQEVYGFGLRGRLDLGRHPAEAADRLVEARHRLRAELARSGRDRLVEPWDPARYNASASVAENLLFGKPVGPAFEPEGVARQPYVQATLNRAGVTDDLVRIGRHVAETMLELFGELKEDRELIDEAGLARAEDVPALRASVARAAAGPLPPADRERLLSLALRLVAARHRLGQLDDSLRRRIVQAREHFAADLPAGLRDAVAFFDPARYNPAATIEENVLFGKAAPDEGGGRDEVRRLIAEVLDRLGLRALVIDVGLDAAVGTGGSRLSPAQRQKASLARALLKRPDLLVLNEATTALDGPSQARVLDGVRQEFAVRACNILWSGPRADLAGHFDRVLVMKGGRLVAEGAAGDLADPDGALARSIAAE